MSGVVSELAQNQAHPTSRMNEKIRTFLPWDEIEPEARAQIENVSKLPFIYKWVAVMPDCHYGKGATVGTVIATKGAVVPAAVGVDIGCGMISVKTRLKRSELKDLQSIRRGLERRIPMSAGKFNSEISESAQKRIDELLALPITRDPEKFAKDWEKSLGTLGGGNHFIEVYTDDGDTVWLTLHSGSRGVGNKIGMHYIRAAQKYCEENSIALPDRDLAYLVEGTEEYDDYMTDLHWAQAFARKNRDEMMDRFLTEMSYQVYGEGGHEAEIEERRINCHHNFTDVERHFGEEVLVTRKGAIKMDVGDWGMIPGSMGTPSYIVSGKGNRDAFHSAPHGAGRRMSRTKARKTFTKVDMEKAMEGIEFRDSEKLVDEIPAAYKDIDEVMEYSKDLVNVEFTLKQIVNCKGD
jgi:tRNA-splicing ligase RtcB (3'-phosphate/5'-hydroxy nucleic acid ligase)